MAAIPYSEVGMLDNREHADDIIFCKWLFSGQIVFLK